MDITLTVNQPEVFRESSSDRYRVLTDTIIKADSVRVPYPVVTNRVSPKDKIYYAAMGIAALVFHSIII